MLVVLFQGTWALAGTTGALNGYVVQQGGTALSDAKVTATSPSQTATTTTDATGHFSFVSLVPDTYTITASKDGFDTTSQSGVTILADATQIVHIQLNPTAKVLGHVTSTAQASLVKAGTTADVYSVNSATTAKTSTLGGGGSLTQAYGAIASQPGVVVPPGQTGWFQTIHIRGGDFDQVGYEYDGVPVLRSYDNYPTTTASALGQQELQIYTGGAPANSESQGLAGYINQVVKSGTYPGYATLSFGIGSPVMYNQASLEVGGATPNRNFSYYFAIGNSSQNFRWFDASNGADFTNTVGAPFANNSTLGLPINLNGYVLANPINTVNVANVMDHEGLVNLHFGIPHHNDAGKDDIQVLYDNSFLHNTYYSSASDWGVPTSPLLQGLNGGPTFGYLSGPGLGWQYLGPVGQALPASMTAAQLQSMVNPVYFAYNPASQHYAGGPFGGLLAPIPSDLRDGTSNPNSLLKLQFQHNIGTDQYIRVYGFQNYSWWPQTCPNTAWTNYIGYCPLNYYVETWTSGASAQYANQINDKNLINFEVSDFWATDYRANDTTMVNDATLFGAPDRPFAYLVSSKNPLAGVCYDSGGNPQSCYSGAEATIGLNAAGTGAANLAMPASCGGAPCEWFVAENGQRGGGNSAKPNFGWVSLQDEWKPSSNLVFNVGLRYTRYFYQLSNTGGPARTFWFNAWNNSHCVLPGAGQQPFFNGLGACPSGDVPATLTNLPNDTETFTDTEPRVGGTYTLGNGDVLRVNYGRYNQPPNTAYEQYNLLQQDLASYDASNFWPIGFTTTTHRITPPTANNYDFSWEHRFAGSDVAFKLTPFLRKTQGQIQNFFLNQKTNFVSGLNAGNQTSDGVEFELTKGDFNTNGLSGLFSFTFTHSFINYSTLANGGSVLSSVNILIQQYNSFTKACAGALPSNNPNSLCGSFGGANAVATESGTGIANPYFNAPAQPLFDLTGNYVPFSTIPGGIEVASGSYETPVAATLVLNFKHDKWAFTPQFQYFEGGYYGDPLTGFGINPASCTAALGGSVTGDPRYPFGGTGTPYDATSCGVGGSTGLSIAVPDPYTGKFDNLGAFRSPNQLLAHLQVSYELSSRVTASANFVNLINQCSGGTAEPWTAGAGNKVCGYTLPGWSPLNYGSWAPTSAGGVFNPGQTAQYIVRYPYMQNPTQPVFNAFFNVQVKL
ncbi:MAG TPA: TonB-dependent receptor [Candidatus Eremiobacteraceae bacterium]|nr:TonB-dependent receptor [Candidatus Eremiobacteraceae bacterium]